jgi:transposase
VDQDQHGAAAWLGNARAASPGRCTTWALENLDLHRGLRHDRIEAPFVIDGPINGEVFLIYIQQALVPALHPGDVVILDNLGSHRGKLARKLIRQAGAHLIFLPPYSPDLNPIEQAFAKFKHLMRKASARTIEATWRAAGELIKQFSPEECANYFANSGYVSA